MLKLFLKFAKTVFSLKTTDMNADKDRSSPVPTDRKESRDTVNQSTETRTANSGSKLWVVILIIVVFLLVILSVTGVVNL